MKRENRHCHAYDWESCIEHFEGKRLSKRNKDLGNQWSKYHATGIKPNYTLIILGSNLIDSFDRCVQGIKSHTSDRQIFWKRAQNELRVRYTSLTRHVYNTLNVIKHNAPYGEMVT